jgi:hypothetical protein
MFIYHPLFDYLIGNLSGYIVVPPVGSIYDQIVGSIFDPLDTIMGP